MLIAEVREYIEQGAWREVSAGEAEMKFARARSRCRRRMHMRRYGRRMWSFVRRMSIRKLSLSDEQFRLYRLIWQRFLSRVR